MNYFYSKVLLFAFPHYITHPAQSVQSGITNTLSTTCGHFYYWNLVNCIILK